jgi:hypothetical protein
LQVNGSGYFNSDNDGESRVLRLDAGANNGNIIQFMKQGSNLWELVGRNGAFYIYKNSGTGSGYRWEIDGNGNHTITGTVLVTSTLSSNGDVVAYASSDRQLKDNIAPIPNALDKVKAIGGYEFDWNDKQDTYEGHDIGVIAQEVEAVLPEIVTTRENGYKAVKYEKLVAVLIEAVKDQQKQIDELKSMINGGSK